MKDNFKLILIVLLTPFYIMITIISKIFYIMLPLAETIGNSTSNFIDDMGKFWGKTLKKVNRILNIHIRRIKNERRRNRNK